MLNHYIRSWNGTFSHGPSKIIHEISALICFILVVFSSFVYLKGSYPDLTSIICSGSKDFSDSYCAVLSVFDPVIFCFKECGQKKIYDRQEKKSIKSAS